MVCEWLLRGLNPRRRESSPAGAAFRQRETPRLTFKISAGPPSTNRTPMAPALPGQTRPHGRVVTTGGKWASLAGRSSKKGGTRCGTSGRRMTLSNGTLPEINCRRGKTQDITSRALRYARLFPPGAERNRLRWIARSLTFFEEDPKGHAKQGRLAAE